MLRGLGSNRTLLLINGHRIPFQLQDLNLLPIAVVERIEVLDRRRLGRIRFRRDRRCQYHHAPTIRREFGATTHHRPGRWRAHEIPRRFRSVDRQGQHHDRLPVRQAGPGVGANRKFSNRAQYIYNTSINTNAGSSRTPRRYFAPKGSPIATQLGCTSVTVSGRQLLPFTSARGKRLRCYHGGSDAFNRCDARLFRTSVPACSPGHHKLTDNVEAYTELLYHKMVAHTQIAPYPFDLTSNQLIIPANQFYNPFGVTFGNNGASSTIALRLSSIGDRGAKLANTTEEGNFGFKGNFGDTSWNWDAHISYGKSTVETQILNISTTSCFGCTTAPGAGNCTDDIFNQN
jgi:hypothetical protein